MQGFVPPQIQGWFFNSCTQSLAGGGKVSSPGDLLAMVGCGLAVLVNSQIPLQLCRPAKVRNPPKLIYRTPHTLWLSSLPCLRVDLLVCFRDYAFHTELLPVPRGKRPAGTSRVRSVHLSCTSVLSVRSLHVKIPAIAVTTSTKKAKRCFDTFSRLTPAQPVHEAVWLVPWLSGRTPSPSPS